MITETLVVLGVSAVGFGINAITGYNTRQRQHELNEVKLIKLQMLRELTSDDIFADYRIPASSRKALKIASNGQI